MPQMASWFISGRIIRAIRFMPGFGSEYRKISARIKSGF
jgi:hypothetical protein